MVEALPLAQTEMIATETIRYATWSPDLGTIFGGCFDDAKKAVGIGIAH